MLADRSPVRYTRPAERVYSHLHIGAANRLHVHDRGKVRDVRTDVVVCAGRGRTTGAVVRHPRDSLQTIRQQAVRQLFDPASDVRIGRTAVGRIVLEAAILRWIVRGGDHNAVGEIRPPVSIVGEDSVRDDGGRRVASVPIDHHLHAVRRQHLEGRHKGGLGEGVGIHAEEKGPGHVVRFPVKTDGLGHSEDVRLVKGLGQGRAAMPRSAERHTVSGHVRIRAQGVIRRHESGNVDQHPGLGRFSG